MDTFVVTLDGVQPSPVFDAPGGITPAPFTTVKWQFSSVSDTGPWVDLETQALVPVDGDPTNPLIRSLTTRLSPAPTGWFRIIFADDSGNSQPTDAVHLIAEALEIPTVDDVAALIRDLTTEAGTGGRELGTFTDATRPTYSQVVNLIDQAYAYVGSAMPGDGPAPRLRSVMRHMVAVYTATLILQSYYRQQVVAGTSGIEVLQAMFDASMTTVATASNDDQPNAKRFYSLPIGTVVASNPAFLESELLP